jgi:hypothetical protein
MKTSLSQKININLIQLLQLLQKHITSCQPENDAHYIVIYTPLCLWLWPTTYKSQPQPQGSGSFVNKQL